MSAPPRIAAVIPTQDRAELLRAALDSLARQTLEPGAFEVVVVDDGSADATSAVVASEADRMTLRYHRLPRSGISAAKNLGLFAARAPVVLFFDDDDVAHPDLLRQHLVAHDEHPDPAVAVLGHTAWSPRLHVSELMHYVTDVGRFLFDYAAADQGAVLDHTFFWGGRASCKRMFLAAEGIFDPSFRFGAEDIELGYRLSGRGFKVVYNARALSYMNRCVTYAEFGRRCERQGRSQYHFGHVLHPGDDGVRRYCGLDGATERWAAAAPHIGEWATRVAELERMLDAADAPPATEQVRAELHRLYGDTFRALTAKGIVEAGGE